MTAHELTAAIKALALRVGFMKAGVTGVEPFDKAADRLAEWTARGAHGLMSYMERGHEKRRDVRKILPEARSILSLALNYYHPQEHAPEALRISRYAWGSDYHDVIPPMLEELLAGIQALAPGTIGRSYTDTGPLLEKAIAERAGVGWIGKHTNLITREVGSWVFLAEILLSVELVPDEPATDHCGTCTRCIDACPTDALTAPYQLDATRCIPYLTIELKPQHKIPPAQASQMATWLYGCDICQEVCPWNRFSEGSLIEAFAPRAETLKLTSEAVEAMTQEEFSARFKGSPIKRTKLGGLKRNLRAVRQGRGGGAE